MDRGPIPHELGKDLLKRVSSWTRPGRALDRRINYESLSMRGRILIDWGQQNGLSEVDPMIDNWQGMDFMRKLMNI